MSVEEIPIDKIDEPSFITRVWMSEEGLEQLKQSLKEHGQLQPIVVTKKGRRFELLIGHRRLTAAKQLGWKTIQARIVKADGAKKIILSETENIVRENEDPMTEALRFKQLHDTYGMVYEAIAAQLGVSGAYVRNRVRLLDLPEEVQALVAARALSPSHALELLRLPKPDYMIIIAKRAIEYGYTVPQIRMEVAKQLEYIRRWEEEQRKQAEEKTTQTTETQEPPFYTQADETTTEPTTPPEEYVPMHKCPICGKLRPVQELHQRLICTTCIAKAIEAAEKEA